ncbi:MAG: hypothetical protein ACRD59_08470 [Candidatus Acidiferrales bacterium]
MQAILVLLLIASGAQAQTGSWQAVENLSPGSIITVRARHHVRCVFRSATDDRLICDPIQRGPIPLGPDETIYDRQDIREVRLDHSIASDVLAGAAIGAGAGAALGASSNKGALTGGGGALLVGGFGMIIGGFVGRDSAILPGKIIYQR